MSSTVSLSSVEDDDTRNENDDERNERILGFVTHFLENRLQYWEHTFLFFDAMDLFPHCKRNTQWLRENKESHFRQLRDEFEDLRKTKYHAFDAFVYQQVVRYLALVAECLSDNHENPVDALAVVPQLYERARQYKLISFRDDGTAFVSETFYWSEVWDRDIEGWELAIRNAESKEMKEWLGRFHIRAIGYKRDHLRELRGGPAVEYDMTCAMDGPHGVGFDV